MARTVKIRGNPIELAGPEIKVGDTAPTAVLKKDLATSFDLSEAAGRPRIYSVVTSLDTGTCALQTRRFNREAAALEGVDFYTISCDLPTAMARFCGAESIDMNKVIQLSDHRNTDFGKAYGTLIPALRVLCRAIFVIDGEDKVRHVEYADENADEPDYETALNVAREL